MSLDLACRTVHSLPSILPSSLTSYCLMLTILLLLALLLVPLVYVRIMVGDRRSKAQGLPSIEEVVGQGSGPVSS